MMAIAGKINGGASSQKTVLRSRRSSRNSLRNTIRNTLQGVVSVVVDAFIVVSQLPPRAALHPEAPAPLQSAQTRIPDRLRVETRSVHRVFLSPGLRLGG